MIEDDDTPETPDTLNGAAMPVDAYMHLRPRWQDPPRASRRTGAHRLHSFDWYQRACAVERADITRHRSIGAMSPAVWEPRSVRS